MTIRFVYSPKTFLLKITVYVFVAVTNYRYIMGTCFECNFSQGIFQLGEFQVELGIQVPLKDESTWLWVGVPLEFLLKGALSGLRDFLATFKNDEKCFLFHFKSSLCSQDIYVFVLTF